MGFIYLFILENCKFLRGEGDLVDLSQESAQHKQNNFPIQMLQRKSTLFSGEQLLEKDLDLNSPNRCKYKKILPFSPILEELKENGAN